jgi:ferredoxin-like protein FixX
VLRVVSCFSCGTCFVCCPTVKSLFHIKL